MKFVIVAYRENIRILKGYVLCTKKKQIINISKQNSKKIVTKYSVPAGADATVYARLWFTYLVQQTDFPYRCICLIFPDFTSWKCGSSCNYLFLGLLCFIFLCYASPRQDEAQRNIDWERKEERTRPKKEIYMNCCIKKFQNRLYYHTCLRDNLIAHIQHRLIIPRWAKCFFLLDS